MSKHEIDYTDDIVCPHCGYEHDPTDWSDMGEDNCDECGKAFTFDANYEVTYSTKCVDHEWGKMFVHDGHTLHQCVVCDYTEVIQEPKE